MATRRSTKEVEVEEAETPEVTETVGTKRPRPRREEAQVPRPNTGAPEVAPDLDENETTTPSSLGFVPKPRPEIEVDALPNQRPRVDPDGMVEVRMARTIEEFTYGNPHRHYRLEAGKRYKLPLHVAQYLDGLEALHHRV